MKTEDLKEKGLTQEQIDFVMAENGKDMKKLQKENETLTTARDGLQKQLDTATETLKKFEGVDVDGVKTELANWKKKAQDAEADLKKQLEERDYSDALKSCMSGIKFSSNAAKSAVMENIRKMGLKRDGDKLLGFEDAIEAERKADPGAFAKEEDPNAPPPPKVITKLGGGAPSGKKYASKDEIMSIKDTAERRAAIAANMNLFQS